MPVFFLPVSRVQHFRSSIFCSIVYAANKITCSPIHNLCGALTAVCVSAGYTLCFGRKSVYLCAYSLQNLAVPQDMYCPLEISVERSCENDLCGTILWPRIRGHNRIPFLWPPRIPLFFCFLVGWSLRTDKVSNNRSRLAVYCRPYTSAVYCWPYKNRLYT